MIFSFVCEELEGLENVKALVKKGPKREKKNIKKKKNKRGGAKKKEPG